MSAVALKLEGVAVMVATGVVDVEPPKPTVDVGAVVVETVGKPKGLLQSASFVPPFCALHVHSAELVESGVSTSAPTKQVLIAPPHKPKLGGGIGAVQEAFAPPFNPSQIQL